MVSILVADDDQHIRELLELYLTMEGYEVVAARDGLEASRLLEERKFHLAVADVMMPRKNGWELCKEIRELYDLPVLLVTAKGQWEDKLKGYQLGTDDYIVKPFDPRELVVRVKAILRRCNVNASGRVDVGGVSLDARTLEAVWDGKPVELPRKEFQLLFKLAGHPGQVFSREQLIEDIWGMDYDGNDRTIDTHIKKIRKKFEGGRLPFRIVSIRGLGYRLEEGEDG